MLVTLRKQWCNKMFLLLECKDRYPSYCRQRVQRFSKEKACNVRGNDMCPKSCGVCSKSKTLFYFGKREFALICN